MEQKKTRIGQDGQLKTVVKATRSRQSRVAQHQHGRSDHDHRPADGDVKFVIYMTLSILCLILLAFLAWLMMR